MLKPKITTTRNIVADEDTIKEIVKKSKEVGCYDIRLKDDKTIYLHSSTFKFLLPYIKHLDFKSEVINEKD